MCNEFRQVSPDPDRLFLVPIVPSCAPVVTSLVYHIADKLLALISAQIKLESFSKWLEAPVWALEARQIKARNHRHLDKWDDLFCMISQCQKALSHELAEFLEPLRVCTAHYINIFFGQLKGDGLKIHITRRVGKKEAKINMHHMALWIQ